MITIAQPQHSRLLLAALAVGAAGTLAQALIGTLTLLSGFNRGWFDIAGAALGVVAAVAVWRRPAVAALLWLLTLPLLYGGGLLVSVACLPVLLLPPVAAGLALWQWWQPHRA